MSAIDTEPEGVCSHRIHILKKSSVPYIPAMEASNEELSGPRPFWQHIAIGLGLLLAAWIAMPADILVALNASSKDWPGDLRRIIKLSEIFAHGFGVALILGSIWLLAVEKRKYIPRLIACAAFPPITAHLIKLSVARRRPTVYLDHYLQPHYPTSTNETWLGLLHSGSANVDYATQAFPSAHAALVCGLAIGMAFVFPRGRALSFSWWRCWLASSELFFLPTGPATSWLVHRWGF